MVLAKGDNDLEKLLEKLSSYNLLNNLLPGAIFCHLLSVLYGYSFLGNDLTENLFIYYFMGVVISRIGSTVIEPILKETKFVIFADYKEFVKASRRDGQIDILSETNNTYRTLIGMALLLALTKVYMLLCSTNPMVNMIGPYVLLIGLIILFVFSYKKQTEYIRKRVETINELANKEDMK